MTKHIEKLSYIAHNYYRDFGYNTERLGCIIWNKLELLMARKKTYKFIDLFAGCGGLSLGLEQAGFTPWFVNELVETFCNTYKKNHNLGDDHYFIGDINELNQHIDDYQNYLTDITLVCGGPPCQGFSMANRQRILDDPRNQLYKAYLYFLKSVRPLFFVMENVKGMSNKIDEIKQNFKDYLGDDYLFDYRLLKAQDFGVPQNRERFIMIGNRVGITPSEIFDTINKYKCKPFVLRDALQGLPHLGAKKVKGAKDVENEESGFTEKDFIYPNTAFYRFINGNKKIYKLYNHKNRYNNPRDIEIYKRLPQGANSLHPSIEDIMPYKSRNGIFKDKYFKLDETQICKTITSHMKYDCNMYIHPWEARGLSPREAARIQTFPDDYIITGAQNMWYAQVGNAVPVKLAKAIGDGLMKFIDRV